MAHAWPQDFFSLAGPIKAEAGGSFIVGDEAGRLPITNRNPDQVSRAKSVCRPLKPLRLPGAVVLCRNRIRPGGQSSLALATELQIEQTQSQTMDLPKLRPSEAVKWHDGPCDFIKAPDDGTVSLWNFEPFFVTNDRRPEFSTRPQFAAGRASLFPLPPLSWNSPARAKID